MLLQLPAAAVAPSPAALPTRRSPRAALRCVRGAVPRRAVVVAAANNKKKAAPEPAEPAELSGPAAAVVYAGLVAIPVTFWSEYTLFSTGAGLQGDALGALEGVSYLVLLAVLGVSLQKKTSTGVGLEGALPGAPRACASGAALGWRHARALLTRSRTGSPAPPSPGAVEGLAFLSALGGVAAAAANALKG